MTTERSVGYAAAVLRRPHTCASLVFWPPCVCCCLCHCLCRPATPHGVPKAAQGKKPVQQPLGKDGRKGLFGLLQGTEAGGADTWIGNMLIDPTKGKRAASAPTDEKRTVSFAQLLAHTAPGQLPGKGPQAHFSLKGLPVWLGRI